jgi:chaperonin GroEL
LVVNRLRNQLKVVAVKAPGFGDNRKAMLEDLAALTGATLFSDELGAKFDKATYQDLGSVKSLQVTKDDTTLFGGAGSKEAVQTRISQIKSLLQTTDSEYEKEKLQQRLAKLSGGVAVIKVGGVSEVEVGEKKDRYVDALNATRAAVEVWLSFLCSCCFAPLTCIPFLLRLFRKVLFPVVVWLFCTPPCVWTTSKLPTRINRLVSTL